MFPNEQFYCPYCSFCLKFMNYAILSLVMTCRRAVVELKCLLACYKELDKAICLLLRTAIESLTQCRIMLVLAFPPSDAGQLHQEGIRQDHNRQASLRTSWK